MATKSFIKTIGSKGLLSDYNTVGKKLQTELTAGDNITIANNVISSNQVFVATYGTTTYQEIKDAYDAGKYVYMVQDNSIAQLAVIDSTQVIFGKLNYTSNIIAVYRVQTNNSWDRQLKSYNSQLTAGDNITIANNVISSNQVFVATYGTTTYQEIKDAYYAGKICLCKITTELYKVFYIRAITESYIRFSTGVGQGNSYSYVFVNNDNTWGSGYIQLQNRLTFDTTPTAGSNNPVTSDGIKTALDSRVPAPTSTTGTQVLKCINGVIQWVNE